MSHGYSSLGLRDGQGVDISRGGEVRGVMELGHPSWSCSVGVWGGDGRKRRRKGANHRLMASCPRSLSSGMGL